MGWVCFGWAVFFLACFLGVTPLGWAFFAAAVALLVAAADSFFDRAEQHLGRVGMGSSYSMMCPQPVTAQR